MPDINNLSIESSLGIIHTNLASLYKYHDDLEQILSLMKNEFQIIGITEHKIKDLTPISNIKLAGYHEFIYHRHKQLMVVEVFIYETV